MFEGRVVCVELVLETFVNACYRRGIPGFAKLKTSSEISYVRVMLN